MIISNSNTHTHTSKHTVRASHKQIPFGFLFGHASYYFPSLCCFTAFTCFCCLFFLFSYYCFFFCVFLLLLLVSWQFHFIAFCSILTIYWAPFVCRTRNGSRSWKGLKGQGGTNSRLCQGRGFSNYSCSAFRFRWRRRDGQPWGQQSKAKQSLKRDRSEMLANVQWICRVCGACNVCGACVACSGEGGTTIMRRRRHTLAMRW